MLYYCDYLTVGELSKIYNNQHEPVPYFVNLSHSKNENYKYCVHNNNIKYNIKNNERQNTKPNKTGIKRMFVF